MLLAPCSCAKEKDIIKIDIFDSFLPIFFTTFLFNKEF